MPFFSFFGTSILSKATLWHEFHSQSTESFEKLLQDIRCILFIFFFSLRGEGRREEGIVEDRERQRERQEGGRVVVILSLIPSSTHNVSAHHKCIHRNQQILGTTTTITTTTTCTRNNGFLFQIFREVTGDDSRVAGGRHETAFSICGRCK